MLSSSCLFAYKRQPCLSCPGVELKKKKKCDFHLTLTHKTVKMSTFLRLFSSGTFCFHVIKTWDKEKLQILTTTVNKYHFYCAITTHYKIVVFIILCQTYYIILGAHQPDLSHFPLETRAVRHSAPRGYNPLTTCPLPFRREPWERDRMKFIWRIACDDPMAKMGMRTTGL